MKNLESFSVIFITILLCVCFSACSDDGSDNVGDKESNPPVNTPAIVGTWELADNVYFDLGDLYDYYETYTFNSNGTCTVVCLKSGNYSSVNGTYTIQGNKLTMNLRDGENSYSDTYTFRMTSDGRLYLKDGYVDNYEPSYKKNNYDEIASAVLGTWKSAENEEDTFRFNADGTFLLLEKYGDYDFIETGSFLVWESTILMFTEYYEEGRGRYLKVTYAAKINNEGNLVVKYYNGSYYDTYKKQGNNSDEGEINSVLGSWKWETENEYGDYEIYTINADGTYTFIGTDQGYKYMEKGTYTIKGNYITFYEYGDTSYPDRFTYRISDKTLILTETEGSGKGESYIYRRL